MSVSDPATPAQFEGQEHEFLRYEHAVVQFIYSFSWNLTKRKWDDLKKTLEDHRPKIVESSVYQGWQVRRLHERAFSLDSNMAACSYQPTLIGTLAVLEYAGSVGSKVTLLIPTEEYTGFTHGNHRILVVSINYTIRLFDNGSGTLTFDVHLSGENVTFENIHFVLHLASNIDFGGDQSGRTRALLTDTYIKIPSNQHADEFSFMPRCKEDALTFAFGYCSLHDLYRRWIVDPPAVVPKDIKTLWADVDVIDTTNRREFQSPFIFTILQVERNSYLRFRKSPTIDHAREVGSILCKLTLDNRHILQHYLNLSDDYIANVLKFSRQRGGLVNLCLDSRLFFALSRRGAIAITASVADLPSCFVIPSLLNLCEILRARWHLGTIVNIKLDKAISQAAGVDPQVSASSVMDQLSEWRALFAGFFRDTIPFLFDGGSVAEIAEIAEDKLWLAKMREEVSRKFAILDHLVQDLYARKRVEELMK